MLPYGELAGVGDQDLVTEPLQEPADPGRVHPGLDGDPHRLRLREAPLEGRGAGGDAALLDHVAAFGVQQA